MALHDINVRRSVAIRFADLPYTDYEEFKAARFRFQRDMYALLSEVAMLVTFEAHFHRVGSYGMNQEAMDMLKDRGEPLWLALTKGMWTHWCQGIHHDMCYIMKQAVGIAQDIYEDLGEPLRDDVPADLTTIYRTLSRTFNRFEMEYGSTIVRDLTFVRLTKCDAEAAEADELTVESYYFEPWTVWEARKVALVMGAHNKRLGAESVLRWVDVAVVKMILDFVMEDDDLVEAVVG